MEAAAAGCAGGCKQHICGDPGQGASQHARRHPTPSCISLWMFLKVSDKPGAGKHGQIKIGSL